MAVGQEPVDPNTGASINDFRLIAAKSNAAAGKQFTTLTDFREWKDATGSFSVIARFLGGNSKEIDLLVQQTNQQIKVPFDKLSANDKAVCIQIAQAKSKLLPQLVESGTIAKRWSKLFSDLGLVQNIKIPRYSWVSETPIACSLPLMTEVCLDNLYYKKNNYSDEIKYLTAILQRNWGDLTNHFPIGITQQWIILFNKDQGTAALEITELNEEEKAAAFSLQRIVKHLDANEDFVAKLRTVKRSNSTKYQTLLSDSMFFDFGGKPILDGKPLFSTNIPLIAELLITADTINEPNNREAIFIDLCTPLIWGDKEHSQIIAYNNQEIVVADSDGDLSRIERDALPATHVNRLSYLIRAVKWFELDESFKSNIDRLSQMKKNAERAKLLAAKKEAEEPEVASILKQIQDRNREVIERDQIDVARILKILGATSKTMPGWRFITITEEVTFDGEDNQRKYLMLRESIKIFLINAIVENNFRIDDARKTFLANFQKLCVKYPWIRIDFEEVSSISYNRNYANALKIARKDSGFDFSDKIYLNFLQRSHQVGFTAAFENDADGIAVKEYLKFAESYARDFAPSIKDFVMAAFSRSLKWKLHERLVFTDDFNDGIYTELEQNLRLLKYLE